MVDYERVREIVREEVNRAVVGSVCPECGVSGEYEAIELEEMQADDEVWTLECHHCKRAGRPEEWEPSSGMESFYD